MSESGRDQRRGHRGRHEQRVSGAETEESDSEGRESQHHFLVARERSQFGVSAGATREGRVPTRTLFSTKIYMSSFH